MKTQSVLHQLTIISSLIFLLFSFNSHSSSDIRLYPVDKLSPSIYVIHGPVETPNKHNQGFMNNPGIVVTTGGVVVIDPGATIEAGEMVVKAAKNISDQPIVAVFNTHVHADHWFGNAGIKSAYPDVKIYAHQKMIDSAQSTGEDWSETIARLTENPSIKTSFIIPKISLKNGENIKVGKTQFTIFHADLTHTNTDVMIAVNHDEALFTGDNLFNGRFNQHSSGHIKNTFEFVEQTVNKLKSKVIVPGHGASGGRDMVKKSLHAHKALYQVVKRLYEEDLSDFEMRPQVIAVLQDYKHWEEFDSIVGKAINKAYLEIEADEF